MKTKTFEKILKEKGYSYTAKSTASNKKERTDNLEEASEEYLQLMGGALFYGELRTGLNKLISKEFYSGKILKRSMEKLKEWEKRCEEGKESWIDKEEQIQKYLESKSKNELVKLRRKPITKFHVENIYEILKKEYNLGQGGVVSFSPDTDLVKKFSLKKLRNNLIKYNFQKRVIEYQNTIWGQKRYEEHLDRLIKYHKNPKKDLMAEYIKTTTKLPIAYFNTGDAIKLFEKETKINLENPKKYGKLIF